MNPVIDKDISRWYSYLHNHKTRSSAGRFVWYLWSFSVIRVSNAHWWSVHFACASTWHVQSALLSIAVKWLFPCVEVGVLHRHKRNPSAFKGLLDDVIIQKGYISYCLEEDGMGVLRIQEFLIIPMLFSNTSFQYSTEDWVRGQA